MIEISHNQQFFNPLRWFLSTFWPARYFVSRFWHFLKRLTIPELVSQLQLTVFYNVGDTQMCRNTQFENHCSNQSVFINCIVSQKVQCLKKFKINLLAKTNSKWKQEENISFWKKYEGTTSSWSFLENWLS